jgi:hypothetical protein
MTEISIEYDPNFGEGSEDDLTPDWQKLALDNTNDDPKLRKRHGIHQIVIRTIQEYQDFVTCVNNLLIKYLVGYSG